MPNEAAGGTGSVPSPNNRETGTTRRSSLQGRKHPAHPPLVERVGLPVIVFLTVCTKARKEILDDPTVHELLVDAWREANSWLIGRYVIMPDHIHLFCAPADPHPTPLLPWVSFWKSRSAQHSPWSNESPIWQRDFWDTQLRRGQNYDEKWEYVAQNPVRASLVERAEDWPYQGELNALRW